MLTPAFWDESNLQRDIHFKKEGAVRSAEATQTKKLILKDCNDRLRHLDKVMDGATRDMERAQKEKDAALLRDQERQAELVHEHKENMFVVQVAADIFQQKQSLRSLFQSARRCKSSPGRRRRRSRMKSHCAAPMECPSTASTYRSSKCTTPTARNGLP